VALWQLYSLIVLMCR